AFANAHAPLIGNIGIPNGILSINANTVRNTIFEVCPYPAIRELSILCDVERGKLLAIGLGDDQSGVVGRDGHSIRKRDSIGNLFDQTITSDQSDQAWSKFLTGHQVKASAVDISVAAAVDDDFVPARGQVAQFRLGDKRPVQFPAQKASVTRRYNQQA